MSLINEALRRAEADQRGESPAAPAIPLVRPPGRPPGGFPRGLGLAAGLLLLIGGAAGWYLVKSGGSPARPQSAVADTSKARPSATQGRDALATQPAATQPAGLTVASPAGAPSLPAEPVMPEGELPSDMWPLPEPESPLAKSLSAAQDDANSLASSAGAPLSAAAAPAAPPAATTQPAAAVQPTALAQQPVAAPPSPAPAAATPPVDLKRYKLTGVLADCDGGTAIINGQVVRIGETVDDAKVVKITGRSVHVEIAGRTYVLGT